MPKDENKRMIFISGKFLSEKAMKIIFTDFISLFKKIRKQL